MQDYPIGIFDSGIGGLTVAHAIRRVLPNEDIIYFGDTEHLPYGEKSKEAIKSYCRKIITFLIKKKCKAIIIACNSASSFADHDVIKLANQIPIFNVIDPVISEISSQIDNSKIYPTNIFKCFKHILADRLPSYKGTLEILMWKK